MFLSFLSMFVNLPMLFVALGVILVLLFVYFTRGPVAVISLLLDARAWIVVGAISAGVVLYHNASTIKKQQDQIATQQVDSDASHDSQAVVTDLFAKKGQRKAQEQTQQQVIDQAPPGDELDALMDEIAKEQSTDEEGQQ